MSFLPSHCRCGAQGFLAPVDDGGADAPPSTFDMIPDHDAAPVAPPPRDLGVATHEAAHAAVGHLVGFHIERVTIDGQACVSWAGMDAARGLDRAMVALAGDIGARLIIHRHEFRPLDDDLIASFATVRALEMGGCDRCIAALSCFATEGAEADDTALLSAYRAAEDATIATLREPRVASAVRTLAGLLLINGTMTGRNVHDALSAVGLPFASLKTPDMEN